MEVAVEAPVEVPIVSAPSSCPAPMAASAPQMPPVPMLLLLLLLPMLLPKLLLPLPLPTLLLPTLLLLLPLPLLIRGAVDSDECLARLLVLPPPLAWEVLVWEAAWEAAWEVARAAAWEDSDMVDEGDAPAEGTAEARRAARDGCGCWWRCCCWRCCGGDGCCVTRPFKTPRS